MTMAKLAALAGVSVSTVSKAFSGSSEISEEKRRHIFETAQKYGCYDKYCKNSYTKKVIAVICPEFKGRYYTEQLAIFEREISRHGAVMIVGSADFDRKKEQDLITFFSEYSKVDGIIVYNMPDNLQKYSLPIVSIGSTNNPVHSIDISTNKAIEDAVIHLLEYGHRDIAFIGEEKTEEKSKTFTEIMKKYRCRANGRCVSISGKRFEAAGYEGMNVLFESDNPPTAVIAAYDYIAIGAMKSIYEHGLRIPEDISIIGMDDINENPYLNVPLTSITTYNEDLCQIAVDALFESIDSCAGKAVRTVRVSADLVKRQSVGTAKEGM